MKKILDLFKDIYSEHRGLLILLIVNFLLSAALFIHSLVTLSPTSSVVRVGYGDISGYRDGAWTGMLVFPLVAVLFGVLHSALAVRIFQKNGEDLAKVFIIVTMVLTIGTFMVLGRLLGEA